MSESFEPASHGILTHSAWRELAAMRAGAVLALGGRLMSPCAALDDGGGGGEARSPADICDMWSSIGGCRWHADRRLAARTAPARTRGEFMKHSERKREGYGSLKGNPIE